MEPFVFNRTGATAMVYRWLPQFSASARQWGVAGWWLGATLCCNAAMAQAPAHGTPAVAASPIVALDWKDLSNEQRAALAPLESTWPQLSPGQKRKWIAVVHNYHQLAQPERTKLHSRMVQWAALNPRVRETARLNFAAAKKLSPAEKAANWEAYQALSPEDKKGLARNNKPPASSTALAAKPAPSSAITPVPVTRRSPKEHRDKVAAQHAIDPNTLLPLAPSR